MQPFGRVLAGGVWESFLRCPFLGPPGWCNHLQLGICKAGTTPSVQEPAAFFPRHRSMVPGACRRRDWIAATLEESCMAHWFSPTSPNFTLFAMI